MAIALVTACMFSSYPPRIIQRPLGKEFMRDREAWDLKRSLAFWNLFLAAPRRRICVQGVQDGWLSWAMDSYSVGNPWSWWWRRWWRWWWWWEEEKGWWWWWWWWWWWEEEEEKWWWWWWEEEEEKGWWWWWEEEEKGWWWWWRWWWWWWWWWCM